MRTRRRRPRFRSFEVAVVLLAMIAATILIVSNARDLPATGAAATCLMSQVAADQAALAFLADQADGSWPADLRSLTDGHERLLVLPDGVVLTSPTTATGRGWTLVMNGGGTTQPSFTCH